MSNFINTSPLIIQETATVESLAGAIKDDMGMLWMLIAGILVFFMQFCSTCSSAYRWICLCCMGGSTLLYRVWNP